MKVTVFRLSLLSFVLSFVLAEKTMVANEAPVGLPIGKSQAGKEGSKQQTIIRQILTPDVSKLFVLPKATDEFLNLFKNVVSQAHQRIKILNGLFTNLSSQIQQMSYASDATVQLVQSDPVNPTQQIGIAIGFGAPGHGDLGPFQGFKFDILIDVIPAGLQVPFKAVLKQLLKPLINGSTTTDPASGEVTLTSSPLMEFLFKVTLLGKDAVTQAIDPKKFGTEMMLLMYRLAQTPEIKAVGDVFGNIPGPLVPLVKEVKIGTKTLDSYVSSIWNEFQSIFNYDFTHPDTSELDIKDIDKVAKVMLAIVLRAAADFTKAKDAKAATSQITVDMTSHFTQLFKRFKFYRMLKPQLMALISPIAVPLFQQVGLSLDTLLPADNQFSLLPNDQNVIKQAGQLLSQDMFFMPAISH